MIIDKNRRLYLCENWHLADEFTETKPPLFCQGPLDCMRVPRPLTAEAEALVRLGGLHALVELVDEHQSMEVLWADAPDDLPSKAVGSPRWRGRR